MFANKKFAEIVLHKFVWIKFFYEQKNIYYFFKIAIPKEKLNDIPIHTFTPLALSKSIVNSERSYSLDNQ